MPRFSVIVPVYNREKYLRQALDSVLAQTVAPYEIIVCDDGSTDASAAIAEEYGGLVKVVHSSRLGPGGARNTAARCARGTHLSFIDSDDMWAPNVLEMVESTLAKTNAVMVWLTSRSSEQFSGWDAPKDLSYVVGGSPFELNGEMASAGVWAAIDRSYFESIGGFVEKMSMLEDWEFLFRMWNVGPIAHIKSGPLVWYRVHAGQSSATGAERYRHCGGVVYERWKERAYGRGRCSESVDRFILQACRRHLGVLKNANLHERTQYLSCCLDAYRSGAIGGQELLWDAGRALLKR